MANQTKHRNSSGQNPDKSVPVPGASGFFGGASEREGSISGNRLPFELARSPPNAANNKNTKHVPCKFFRQGTCQAGNACPFSHSMDPMTQQAPCKYFMKGNCRFGAKCALAHYLPDGRRVNRAELDAGMNPSGRPFPYPARSDQASLTIRDSGMNDGLLRQQPYPSDYFPNQPFPMMEPDEADAFNDRYNQYSQATFESGLNSPPTSQFGSPTNHDFFLPKSPIDNLRTALNAPLPQSFDANGMSHIAQYGPLGQSVPDKFGMRSPASSSLSKQLGSPPDGASQFRGNALNGSLRMSSPLGLSPHNMADESPGFRTLHSQRHIKSRVLSASVPRTSNPLEWEDKLGTETDLLPNSLHDEVLTPQEKMRRLSRPEQDYVSRDSSNGLAIPSRNPGPVGSPPSGSPSRFSALWAEQREKKAAEHSMNNGYGHVGSPLREAWIPPSRNAGNAGAPISGISQAMARMQLNPSDGTDSDSSRGPSSGVRQSSALMGRSEKAVSSPRLGSRRPEDESDPILFPMDEDKKYNSMWPGLGSQPVTPGGRSTSDESAGPKRENGLGIGSGGRPIFGFRS